MSMMFFDCGSAQKQRTTEQHGSLGFHLSQPIELRSKSERVLASTKEMREKADPGYGDGNDNDEKGKCVVVLMFSEKKRVSRNPDDEKTLGGERLTIFGEMMERRGAASSF